MYSQASASWSRQYRAKWINGLKNKAASSDQTMQNIFLILSVNGVDRAKGIEDRVGVCHQFDRRKNV